MSTVSTKHRPNRDTPVPATREVDIPAKVEKAAHESNSISLGAREPEEGRYLTLSQKTYQAGSRQAPGEMKIVPKSHDEVYSEAKNKALEMRTRHFFQDEPNRLLVSESRGAHAPPPPGSIHSNTEHNRENAMYMNSHNMFIAKKAKEDWSHATSTNRASYGQHDTNTMVDVQKSSAQLRKLQQQTHFALGTAAADWRSDYGANFKGEQEAVKTTLCKANVGSTINIGNSQVDVKDSLKSLKQVDFRPHNERRPPAPVNHNQQTSMVLGFQDTDMQSLHRASYTPTVFVNPAKGRATPVSPGAASGMGSSPARSSTRPAVGAKTSSVHGLPPI